MHSQTRFTSLPPASSPVSSIRKPPEGTEEIVGSLEDFGRILAVDLLLGKVEPRTDLAS